MHCAAKHFPTYHNLLDNSRGYYITVSKWKGVATEVRVATIQGRPLNLCKVSSSDIYMVLMFKV